MPAPRIAQQWKALALPWHLGLDPEFLKNEKIPANYAHISCLDQALAAPQQQATPLVTNRGWIYEHFCNSDRKRVGVLRISNEYGDNLVMGDSITEWYPNVHTLLIDKYNAYTWTMDEGWCMKHVKRVIFYGDPKLVEPIYFLASCFPTAQWIFLEMGYEQQYDRNKFRDILMLLPETLKGLCFYSSSSERETWATNQDQPVRDFFETPSDWQSYEIVDFYDIMEAKWSYMVYERRIDNWMRRRSLVNNRKA